MKGNFLIPISLLVFSFFLLSISSCGWITDCLADCGGSYDFTLNYSIPEAKDTMQVGDTLTIIHEMPFMIAENDNGVVYDIEGIPYRVGFVFGKTLPEMNLGSVSEEEIEINETGKGSVSKVILNSGSIVYNVTFESLDERLYFEVKAVLKKQGEFILGFNYLESDLWSINIPNVDTCCLSQTVFFDYHFEQDIPSRFEKDSIWIGEGSREVNMLEQDRMYDYYTFVVVE